MHSGCTLVSLLVIIFANPWVFGQSLVAGHLEIGSSQNITFKYKVVPGPLDGNYTVIAQMDTSLGAIGYVYKGNVFNYYSGGPNISYVYINIHHHSSPYNIRVLPKPSTSAGLLEQVNTQGASGFRYKQKLYNGTDLFEYVQDVSRPLAKYIYRHGQCARNRHELLSQIKENAAEGYHVVNSFHQGNFCILYIKDTSKRSHLSYKLSFGLTNNGKLLNKSNELGPQGYRFAGYGYVEFLLNGADRVPLVPLFYRDKTQKNCTYSYSSTPLPASPDQILPILQEQQANGFIFVATFLGNASALFFEKFDNCHYKRMNIDAYY